MKPGITKKRKKETPVFRSKRPYNFYSANTKIIHHSSVLPFVQAIAAFRESIRSCCAPSAASLVLAEKRKNFV